METQSSGGGGGGVVQGDSTLVIPLDPLNLTTTSPTIPQSPPSPPYLHHPSPPPAETVPLISPSAPILHSLPGVPPFHNTVMQPIPPSPPAANSDAPLSSLPINLIMSESGLFPQSISSNTAATTATTTPGDGAPVSYLSQNTSYSNGATPLPFTTAYSTQTAVFNVLSSVPSTGTNQAPSSLSLSNSAGNQSSTTVPPPDQTNAAYQAMANVDRYDPLASPDWDRAGPPGSLCAGRVRKDLSSIFHEPLPGIFAVPEEGNMFKVHGLIIGPFETPYEGGFFHFLVRFGPQYPLHPPRVKLLTTGGGRVRFNPNLYRSGKVCLSILGTWPGPAWSPASNLSSVLLSLQSLINERPYHNEPGYEKERNIGDSERYNQIIEHESIRVSVVQQLEASSPTMPADLLKVMQESFMEYYDHYVDVCHKNMPKDGTTMNDPFGEVRGKFRYASLLKQLRKLKAKLKASGVGADAEKAAKAAGNGGVESEDASSISGSEDSGNPESLEEL